LDGVNHLPERLGEDASPIREVLPVDGQAEATCLSLTEVETKMSKFLKLIKNEKGATAIEYGLIAALIAVAAIGAMQGIGNKLNTTFNNVSNKL
jgi:pilus assembly protein Flp/PilA